MRRCPRSARSNPSVTRQPLSSSVPRVLFHTSQIVPLLGLPRVATGPFRDRWDRDRSHRGRIGGKTVVERERERERRDDTCSHRCDQQVNSSRPKIETIGEFLSGVFAKQPIQRIRLLYMEACLKNCS